MVALAAAISVDYNFFSQHSSGGGLISPPLFMPVPLPGGGMGGEAAAGGAAADGAAGGGAAAGAAGAARLLRLHRYVFCCAVAGCMVGL